MKIPLDYYRILGLPVQATPEQVRQAHYDRTLQRPRWDYSEVSLAARKSLLDEAYHVLSSPTQRKSYDTQFLAQTLDYPKPLSDPSEADTVDLEMAADLLNRSLDSSPSDFDSETHLSTPTLEISDDQFIGALIIYLELSEYELVLNLGETYGDSLRFSQLALSHSASVQVDLVLTVAIASLELGREQWRQGHYEVAAESLQTGLDFLGTHQVLPDFTHTIETELYKLRPYRILELLALPEDRDPARLRGLQLLRNMLAERHGIDGAGDDRSGLSTEEFLRFIQQLRDYLTASEQVELLDQKGGRWSAVAAYLQVYALVAEGFSQRQPALIQQASQLLNRLSPYQDVQLEQAVCALLLGQPQISFQLLDSIPDSSVLQFVQEHSPDSSDLLPGLCRYVEHWLQEDVLPYCRGLAKFEAHLNPYFGEPEVQAYLEHFIPQPDQLFSNADPQYPHLSETGYRQPKLTQAGLRDRADDYTLSPDPILAVPGFSTRYDLESLESFESEVRSRSADPAYAYSQDALGSGSAQATLNSTRVTESLPLPLHSVGQARLDSPAQPKPRRQVRQNGHSPSSSNADVRQRNGKNASVSPRSGRRKPGSVLSKWGGLGGWVLGGLGLAVVYLAWRSLFPSMATSESSEPELVGDQLAIRLDEALISDSLSAPISSPTPAPAANQTITKEQAQQTIESWLKAKSDAMGETHNIQSLESVLTGTMLTQWRQTAQQAKQEGWYIKYNHALKPDSLNIEALTPQRSEVYVAVRETAQEFQSGSDQPQNRSEDSLVVRYELVLFNQKWRIQAAEVVKQG